MYVCACVFDSLFVLVFCPSILLSGKPLSDPNIEVRNVFDKFLGAYSHSIKAVLCHGVSQEGLDPLKSREVSLILLLSLVWWWWQSYEDWQCQRIHPKGCTPLKNCNRARALLHAWNPFSWISTWSVYRLLSYCLKYNKMHKMVEFRHTVISAFSWAILQDFLRRVSILL